MAVTATPYAQFLLLLGAGGHNLGGDRTAVALLKGGYAPDMDAHGYFSEVQGADIGATGDYSPGGNILSGKTLDNVPGAGAVLNAAALTWSNLTVPSVRYAVLYAPDRQGRPLIGLLDLGERSYTAGTLTLSFPDGVLLIRAAA